MEKTRKNFSKKALFAQKRLICAKVSAREFHISCIFFQKRGFLRKFFNVLVGKIAC